MAQRLDLVVDSSIALRASVYGKLQLPGRWRLRAPRLLWSEALSALHEATWRAEIDATVATAARQVLNDLPIEIDEPPGLSDEAWRIADQLGLAKTYDCEFLALAAIRGCLLVTVDARLRRGADRLGFVVDPIELASRR